MSRHRGSSPFAPCWRPLVPTLSVISILAGAVAARAWDDVPFHAATASVQQGLLDRGTTRDCSLDNNTESVAAAPFVFKDNDPGQDHLYQAYDYYNSGPQRCVQVKLRWTHQDCGGAEIGIGLYLGSFNPADPRQNLLTHSYKNYFDISGIDFNDYRQSPGYYRDAWAGYHLDDSMRVAAVVPALAHVVIVLDSTLTPGSNLNCPVDPDTSSLVLEPIRLDTVPMSVSVNDVSNYEYNPPSTPTLKFGVSLSRQFDAPFTVHFATSDGTAVAGVDYTSNAGDLTFAPGETFHFITVNTLPNVMDETPPGEKTVHLTLSAPSSPYVQLADATAVGKILDDDDTEGLCAITNFVGNGDLPLGHVGQPYGPVDLRGYSATFDPTMNYGWAQNGGVLPPGVVLGTTTVEDPPGSGNQEVHGQLSGTPTAPGVYFFNVLLTCPVDDPDPGTPPPQTYERQFRIEVLDNAPQAIFTMPDVAHVEGNAGTTPVNITMNLSQPLDETLPLEVLLFDGSASTADNDYVPLLQVPQPTEIAAGVTQEFFSLDIVGDTKVENDETFLVQVRTAVSHTVLGTATVTILNDDAPLFDVPTLGDLGLGALALGLAGAGLRSLRRRRERERRV